MNTTPHAQQIALLRNLKGAPISIIWALLMANMYAPPDSVRTLKNSELEMWTGYSDKPISNALDLLHAMGMVSQNSAGGWYLTTAAYQLPLPLWLPDGRGRIQDTPISEASRRNSPTSYSSSSSRSIIQEEEEEKKEKPTRDGNSPPASRPPSRPVDNSVDNHKRTIKDLLLRAGVGEKSPKMKQLLAMNLDIKYVEAHVLERLYQARLHEANPKQNPNYPVAWLINKLICADPSPAPRCPTCLQNYSYCYCQR